MKNEEDVFDEARKAERRGCLVMLLVVVVECLLVVMLCSCATKKPIAASTESKDYIVKTDTMRLANRDSVWLVKHDSVFVHDSIMVDRWLQGDTVYLTKTITKTVERWHLADKGRTETDSVYIHETDTIVKQETVTIEKIIPAELTKAQKRYINIGKFVTGLLALAIVALIGYLAWRLRQKLK